MLFASEMTEVMTIGDKDIEIPGRWRMIAETQRMAVRKRRELARRGIDMHRAIELALLGNKRAGAAA